MELKGKIFRKYVGFVRLLFPEYTYLEEFRFFLMFYFNGETRVVGFLRFIFCFENSGISTDIWIDRDAAALEPFMQRCVMKWIGKTMKILTNPFRILKNLQWSKNKGKFNLQTSFSTTITVLIENNRTALTTLCQEGPVPDCSQQRASSFLSCSVLQESLLKATLSVTYSQEMPTQHSNPLLTICGHLCLWFALNYFLQ